jgi:uncharacterized delta-60 repeat protein
LLSTAGALLSLAMLTPRAHALPGDLDATWGTGGIVRRELATSATAWTLTEQPDGAVLVGIRTLGSPRPIHIARHTADGALDPTFGTGGEVTTVFPGENAELEAVLVQPDGKIVAVGRTIGASTVSMTLVRYLASGALDASFGTGGIVQEFSAYTPNVFSAVLAPDGDILVSSTASLGGTGTDFSVARFNGDGSRDLGFGTGGLTSVNLSAAGIPNDFGTALALQPDGKIVVAGYFIGTASNDVALARFTAAGGLDASFGTGGVVKVVVDPWDESIAALALQPDGKIVVAGTRQYSPTNMDQLVMRFTAGGTLDGTFGTGGVVTTNLGDLDFATAVAVQPGGEIVTAGGGRDPVDTTLVRHTGSGALDPTFGIGGIVTTTHAGGPSSASSLLRAADASLLVGGAVADAGDPPNDLVVARYVDRPHATTVPVAYGTWALGGPYPWTFTFFDVATSVFGTTVNLGTTVGSLAFVPTVTPQGRGVLLTGEAIGPNLTLGLDAYADLGVSAVTDVPVSFAVTSLTGSALPAGPEYRFIGTLDLTMGPLEGPFLLSAILPANTEAGTDVVVTSPGVTLTFSNVVEGGDTLITQLGTAPAPLPAKFTAAGVVNGMFTTFGIDISTTATFSGPVTICLAYTPGAVQPHTIGLVHFTNGQYLPVPLTIYPERAEVCGEVDGFSPFVFVEEGPDAEGFLPAVAERSCSRKQHKLAAKLGRAVFKCRDKRIKAALAGKPSTESACLSTARDKFDVASARLQGCAPCTAANRAAMRDLVADGVLTYTAGIYCDGTDMLAADDFARVPPDATVGGCESRFGKQASKLFGAYVQCLVTSAATGAPDAACEETVRAKYDAMTMALSGCTCAAANGYGIGNLLERLVDRDLNPLLYCAGTVPFP